MVPRSIQFVKPHSRSEANYDRWINIWRLGWYIIYMNISQWCPYLWKYWYCHCYLLYLHIFILPNDKKLALFLHFLSYFPTFPSLLRSQFKYNVMIVTFWEHANFESLFNQTWGAAYLNVIYQKYSLSVWPFTFFKHCVLVHLPSCLNFVSFYEAFHLLHSSWALLHHLCLPFPPSFHL